MITCYLAPTARVIRRVIVARPRASVIAAATGAIARRVIRPAVSKPLLVCRDLGALALAANLGGAAPLIPVNSGGPAGMGAGVPAMALPASGGGGLFAGPLGGGLPFQGPFQGQMPPSVNVTLLIPQDNTLLIPPDLLLNPTRPNEVLPNAREVPLGGATNPPGERPVAVPEPSSLAILLAAVAGCLLLGRSRS